MDPIFETFEVCDLDNNGLTFDEIQKSDCLEIIEQYGIENLSETFLEIDANKDNVITKQEGEDAAFKNFDRSGKKSKRARAREAAFKHCKEHCRKRGLTKWNYNLCVEQCRKKWLGK